MAKRRITITELAQELNTTASTVSRALRGHSSISKEMKERVQELAAKRNYKVNRMAANLRSGESKILGVVVPRVNRDFFSNCIAGIEELATKAGYSIIICQTEDDEVRERKSIMTLIESNVAGILISTGSKVEDLEVFSEVKRLGIPIIFFDKATKSKSQNKVEVNDKLGAYMAVCHLLEKGYKRIAHFSGSQDIRLYRERKKGYLKALHEKGIEVDESLIIHNTLQKKEGYEAATILMNMEEPPDSIFSASDYSALGAIIRLKELGISIPEDMGIVGYSNEMFTNIISPRMTTIDQHSIRIGNCAVRACMEAINEKDEFNTYKNVVIEPTLIVRESTDRVYCNGETASDD